MRPEDYPNQTAGLGSAGPAYHEEHSRRSIGTLHWTDKRLKQITRLRLLTDPGVPWWDVSYCHGETVDGFTCRVALPFSQLPKRGMMRAIVEYAIRDGVHAKRLGALDNISKLW